MAWLQCNRWLLLTFCGGWSCGRTSWINGQARAERPSTFEAICPLRHPMEGAMSLSWAVGVPTFHEQPLDDGFGALRGLAIQTPKQGITVLPHAHASLGIVA
jgi:hypothetical protein